MTDCPRFLDQPFSKLGRKATERPDTKSVYVRAEEDLQFIGLISESAPADGTDLEWSSLSTDHRDTDDRHRIA